MSSSCSVLQVVTSLNGKIKEMKTNKLIAGTPFKHEEKNIIDKSKDFLFHITLGK
jgi:hypothetical protein